MNGCRAAAPGGDARTRPACRTAPPPNRVRYNEWPRVAVPDAAAFIPTEGVTVVVAYHGAPADLALAALERQRYPHELVEVVVVDGSRPPPPLPPSPLAVRRVRPGGGGFGTAHARNAGARAARHDILVFLDADVVADEGLLAAHARWHHAVADALTVGFLSHVDPAGVDARAVAAAPSVAGLFGAAAEPSSVEPPKVEPPRVEPPKVEPPRVEPPRAEPSRVEPPKVEPPRVEPPRAEPSRVEPPRAEPSRVEPPRVEPHMARTDDLTSRHDDLFRAVTGANFAIRRGFYEALGGSDPSLTGCGGEDVELGYRAYTAGGLLVPVRDAMVRQPGTRSEERDEKTGVPDQRRVKLANLVAHEDFRPRASGRVHAVPMHVVTVAAEGEPAPAVAAAVESLLLDPAGDGDLVVRVEADAISADTAAWLADRFGGDPRVNVAAERSGLDAYPASPLHVTVPAAPAPPGLLAGLRAGLGSAAVGTARLGDGTAATITRAWAAHRARRTGGSPGDFGDTVHFTLGRRGRVGRKPPHEARKAPPGGPHTAWRYARRVWRGLRWRLGTSRPAPRTRRSADRWRADTESLGVDIAASGPRAAAVFAAAGAPPGARRGRVDVILADERAPPDTRAPVVVLARSPGLLSVPAVDPRRHNPVGWVRNVENGAAALGPRPLLPADAGVRRTVRAGDLATLRHCHHLEDIAAFHAGPLGRAATLVRLAATGVPVHLADGGPGLADLLGTELHALMTAPDLRTADIETRERLSIAMRRVALREHSLASRARQVCAAAGVGEAPGLPKVSVLLPTRRPALLGRALASVARQGYPNLELVLALHGEGFGEVGEALAGLGCPAKVCRVAGDAPVGSVLAAATAAAGGTLLARMDDDDLYGADHIRDLVLAREYSGAELVGKGIETVYLAGPGCTVRLRVGTGETYRMRYLSGGALLVSRHALERAGGWPRVERAVENELIDAVHRGGLGVYRLHGAGYVVVRHGANSSVYPDEYYLRRADAVLAGLRAGADLAWAEGAMTGGAGTGAAPPAPVREPDAETAWPARRGRIELRPPSRVRAMAGRARRLAQAYRDPWQARVRWMGVAVAAGIGPSAAAFGALAAAAPSAAHRAVATDAAEALAAGRREDARAMLATLVRGAYTRVDKIVSRRYRYLWICNPKVASRSLIAALLDADPQARLFREATLAEVHRALPESRRFTSFAFVRDPCERAHSFFSDAGPSGDKRGEQLAGRYGIRRDSSFAELCAWLNTPCGADAFANAHWLSQHVTIRLEDGRLPDFIGRYERLEADLAEIASRLGMPLPILPSLNRSPYALPESPVSSAADALRAVHLNERNRAELRRRYATDFALFGYAP